MGTLSNAGQIALAFTDAESLAVTINNGLSGLAEEVIPELAQPDFFEFPDALFWDNEHVLCLRVDAGVKNSSLSAPVTPGTVTGFFGNNGKVFADADLDSIMRTTFFWDAEAAPGFTFCDLVAAVDEVGDWLLNLLGDESAGSQDFDDISFEELSFTAQGLTADIDLTLGLVGSTLQVTSIDQLNVEIGSIDYAGTPLLELLASLATTGVNLAFGDVTDFINDQLNQNVIPEQEPRLQAMVNTALQQNLAIEESIALSSYSATVDVSAATLISSRSANTMTMEFTFDISSAASTASCAQNLSFLSSPSGTPQQSSSDFDIQIPHWVIARCIYEAGRQGLFCQSTLMPFSNVPWTIQPNGTLSVSNGRYTATETSPSGFPISRVYHQNELRIDVPMIFSGVVGGYQGLATADLQIYVQLDIPRNSRSVYLVVTEAGVANVSGALTLANGTIIDMTPLIDTFLDQATDILASSLGAIPILPKTTTFAENLGIEINQVLINNSHTTVGVNIVPVVTRSVSYSERSIGTTQHQMPGRDDVPNLNSGIRDQLDPLP